jgi:replication factor C small subunit
MNLFDFNNDDSGYSRLALTDQELKPEIRQEEPIYSNDVEERKRRAIEDFNKKSMQILKPEIKPDLEPIKEPLTVKIELKTVDNINNNIWFEKYRPKTFNEILGQQDIIKTIKNKLNNLPHMILEGNAGIGKTSLVNVLVKELNCDMLELNGSDERGIDIIRGKVTTFIRHASFNKKVKIVFFDEADSMTPEAQLCLRTIIEKYSFNTRFIFACNDIKKIIEPLKSRCKTFSFKPITPEAMIERLKFIVDNEGISISEYKLKEIIDSSHGDFRKAINELQSI